MRTDADEEERNDAAKLEYHAGLSGAAGLDDGGAFVVRLLSGRLSLEEGLVDVDDEFKKATVRIALVLVVKALDEAVAEGLFIGIGTLFMSDWSERQLAKEAAESFVGSQVDVVAQEVSNHVADSASVEAKTQTFVSEDKVLQVDKVRSQDGFVAMYAPDTCINIFVDVMDVGLVSDAFDHQVEDLQDRCPLLPDFVWDVSSVRDGSCGSWRGI